MRSIICRTAALVLLSSVVFYGCGGVSGGGIGGTGVAQGVISNSSGTSGGISVSGIDFNIDSADIILNGAQAAAHDLKPGMVVTVTGTINNTRGTGIADEVRFDSLVRGAVESVDVTQGVIIVFGQPTFITTGTVFDGTSLATLQAGTTIEISGLTDTAGDITATRVTVINQAGSFFLRGRIKAFDGAARTFRIRRVLVDFSSATILSAPTGGLANGQLARIVTTGVSGSLVIAGTIEARDSDIDLVPGLLLRVEGFITEVVNGSLFVLNDQIAVRLDPTTTIAGGGGARDLQPDTHILVEGKLDTNLRLVALRIDIRTPTGGVPIRR